MVQPEQQSMSRVRSSDGTDVAYFTSGNGPSLVLVHGLLGDHTRWDALRPLLEPHLTIHAMDRRGRGASGDAPEYAFERECEDVAAVVDAVVAATGAATDLLGSSGGALYAMGATALTPDIHRLALFEPPPTDIAQLLPSGLMERLDALLAAGDREGLLVAAYRAIVGLSAEEIDHLRSQPAWPNRIAAAHTVPRELRLPPDRGFVADHAQTISAPSLVLVGSETPGPYRANAEAVAAALPDAELAILEGQGHGAEMFAPEVVAERLLAFLRT